MKKLLPGLCAFILLAQSSSVVGTWKGAIDTGDANIHISMRVAKNTDGSLAVVVDSPERNAKDSKADAVKPTADGFVAESKAIGVKCEAKLSSDGSALDTTWDAPEGSAPARLRRQGEGN